MWSDFSLNTVYQIQPEYGDEQADAGRDCRTSLSRPNSYLVGTNADREIFIFPLQLTTCRIAWQPYPVDSLLLLYVSYMTHLVTESMYIEVHCVLLSLFWCPYMVINVCAILRWDSPRYFCCFVSHIQRIGCQPEKTTLHGGQSCSWSSEQGKVNKRKSLVAYPPPTLLVRRN